MEMPTFFCRNTSVMVTRKQSTEGPKPKAARRKLYSAPALEKGLDILELLAKEPESISLKEIAERLRRSVGEIFRMLAVLEQRGFVRLGENSDRYELTMRLFQLAHWHLPINRLTSAAAGPMRRLALNCGQSCHLTTLSGSKVVVLSKQDSAKDRSFSMRVGAESPILSSCSGRIIFALADEPTRTTLLASVPEDSSAALVEAAIKLAPKIRRTGLLEIPSDHVAGITDMGTPIFGHDGTVSAALVIPFLHRIGKDSADYVEQVRRSLVEAGKEISAALGAE